METKTLKTKQKQYCRAKALIYGSHARPSPPKKVTIVSSKIDTRSEHLTKQHANQIENNDEQLINKRLPVFREDLRNTRSTFRNIDRELVGGSPSERNWRGILIALLVITAVLGMIVFSIVLVSPVESGSRVRGRRPTLLDALNLAASAAVFNGTWISDTELVYRDPLNGITVLNAENMTTRVLMTNSTFRQHNAVDFKVSSDLQYVLLISDVTKVFKFTTLAKYYVYEFATRNHFPLSPRDDDPTAPLLQYAAWSPDGRGVAFIHEHDVYYKPSVQKALVCRITYTAEQQNRPGHAPIIQNGIPDWLYEHEILKTGHVIEFSPDGQYLMYMVINNTQVATYKYPWYGTSGTATVPVFIGGGNSDDSTRFPQIREIKYPRVGSPNPNVTVWVVKINRLKYMFPASVQPPVESLVEGVNSYYITSVKWYSERNLAVVWLNRAQNQSIMAICKAPTFNCTTIHTEKPSEGVAWVHTTRHPVWGSKGDSLHLLPVEEKDIDDVTGSYLHLCMVFAKNEPVKPLTHGKFEVTDILGWDEENHIIYVIATPPLKPGERHLYRIGDTNSSLEWQCVTCPTELESGEQLPNEVNNGTSQNVFHNESQCLYNKIVFSPGFRYYIQECMGPSTPSVHLFEVSTGMKLAELDSGHVLKSTLEVLAQPQIRTFQVEIEDGYKAQVKLYLPPGMREQEEITYPLILLIDAEPGTQSVTEKWSSGWAWYLAANRSFMVAQVDGRGSGGQGERMRTEIHHRLGSVDVQDQLSVLTYLRSALPCAGVCVAGEPGYGSYIALTLLALDTQHLVNCTVALSPITSWPLHNSYFTERYLGTSASDLLHADLAGRGVRLAGRRLLLAHGTADTTVHAPHSMALVTRLVRAAVLFTQLTYPDVGHTFDGVQTHLYKQVDSFFDDTLFDAFQGIDGWEHDPAHDDSGDLFFSFRN